MSLYRITREDFYDEKGKTLKILFLIQKQNKFLFIKWWSYVKHKDIGIKTLKNTPLHFDNMWDAEVYIKDILSKKKTFKNYKFVIKVIDTKKND
jgi:hypothetical protein